MNPALVGGFFTTSTTWEAHYALWFCSNETVGEQVDTLQPCCFMSTVCILSKEIAQVSLWALHGQTVLPVLFAHCGPRIRQSAWQTVGAAFVFVLCQVWAVFSSKRDLYWLQTLCLCSIGSSSLMLKKYGGMFEALLWHVPLYSHALFFWGPCLRLGECTL